MTDTHIANFPHGMESSVFVWTEIPRDLPSFRVMDTYKGVGNYKYRALINSGEGPRAGWIIEDVCESVLCCVAARVSVPMTRSASLVPATFLQV